MSASMAIFALVTRAPTAPLHAGRQREAADNMSDQPTIDISLKHILEVNIWKWSVIRSKSRNILKIHNKKIFHKEDNALPTHEVLISTGRVLFLPIQNHVVVATHAFG